MGKHERAASWGLAIGIAMAAGCGGSETPPTSNDDEATTSEQEATTDTTADEREAEASSTLTPTSGREVIVGRIVEESPIGDGDRCTQHSYRVERDEGSSEWLHAEVCVPPSEPASDDDTIALRVGTRYRFEVVRGGSPNYADGPLILRATPQ
ncbi:MAG: hypothetical protein AB7S26_39300 [Sandaracinaceae bacterium]